MTTILQSFYIYRNMWSLFCDLEGVFSFTILRMSKHGWLSDHYSAVFLYNINVWSLFCDLEWVFRFTILRISNHGSMVSIQWSWLISSMVRFQFPLFCGLYPNQVALIWYNIRLISSVVRSQIVFSHYSASEYLLGMVFQFLLFLIFLPCVLFSIFLCDRMYPSYDLFLALITLLNVYIELW